VRSAKIGGKTLSSVRHAGVLVVGAAPTPLKTVTEGWRTGFF
jgi:hypothetical protein